MIDYKFYKSLLNFDWGITLWFLKFCLILKLIDFRYCNPTLIKWFDKSALSTQFPLDLLLFGDSSWSSCLFLHVDYFLLYCFLLIITRISLLLVFNFLLFLTDCIWFLVSDVLFIKAFQTQLNINSAPWLFLLSLLINHEDINSLGNADLL